MINCYVPIIVQPLPSYVFVLLLVYKRTAVKMVLKLGICAYVSHTVGKYVIIGKLNDLMCYMQNQVLAKLQITVLYYLFECN